MMGKDQKDMTRRRLLSIERLKQEARLKRFLALPPELQEGVLRYADNIRGAYRGKDEVQNH